MRILPDLDMTKVVIEKLDGTLEPVLDIEVIPSTGSDPKKLEFTWEALQMDYHTIKFKLKFKDAVFVSSTAGPDIIRFTFRDRYIFIGTNNLPISNKSSSDERRILQDSENEGDDELVIIEKELPTQL